MLRKIDRFLDPQHLAPGANAILQGDRATLNRSGTDGAHAGCRPLRFGIRSERRLREEVDLNLA